MLRATSPSTANQAGAWANPGVVIIDAVLEPRMHSVRVPGASAGANLVDREENELAGRTLMRGGAWLI